VKESERDPTQEASDRERRERLLQADKDSGSEASQQGSEADQPDTATSLNNINLVPIKPAPRKEKLRPSQSSTSCEPPSAVEMTAP
jgi:hypothetical protein